MKIINLTKQTIKIIDQAGQLHTFGPCHPDEVAYMPVQQFRSDPVYHDASDATFDVFETEHGDIVGIPDPQEDAVFVVPAMIASRLRREDVVSIGPAVRRGGEVIGNRGFSSVWEGGEA